MLDFSRCRFAPMKHQEVGASRIYLNDHPDASVPRVFALFDECGVGKTKQAIDAACFLFEAGHIDSVVVVAPASVRSAWTDPDEDIGEIAKHCWVQSYIIEFHRKTPTLPDKTSRQRDLSWNDELLWIVTNYEFIRREERRTVLNEFLQHSRSMLICDESSYLANWKALQTRAVEDVRKWCHYAVILNGTPINRNPLDLYSQMHVLSPRILGSKNFYTFRARYAVMGGWQNKQVVKFQNLEELQSKIAPYALRRTKDDCLDLPPLTETVIETPLTDETWKLYTSMRDDMVAWLDAATPALAAQAGVKVLRLAQLTSGFLGGLHQLDDDTMPTFEADDELIDVDQPVSEILGLEELTSKDIANIKAQQALPVVKPELLPAREVGREKLDLLLKWIEQRLADEDGLKFIVWCRFRDELKRCAREVRSAFGIDVHEIIGGQKEKERDAAKHAFVNVGKKPCAIIGNARAGGFGLNNFVHANYALYLSNDFSLLTRIQSRDRVHRTGQVRNVLITDVLATGPKGQKTIDHTVVKALRKKQDLASWTSDKWRQVLLSEGEE